MATMPKVKLHWSPKSPYVRKVMVAAHETGTLPAIELTRSVVAMTGTNEPLMRDNPLNKIPTLITPEGTALFDSMVICEYLDHWHDGPKLFPNDFDERMRALRWHALAQGFTDLLIFWNNERNRPPAQQSAELHAAWGKKFSAALDVMERDIGSMPQAFNIGHIGLGCALGYADFRFSDKAWRNNHPALAAWFAGIMERPSFQATIPPAEG